MKDLVHTLTQVMEAEIAVQERTLAKLEEQQKIIVEYTLDKLEENLRDLDKLRPEIRKLDKVRLDVKNRLADKMGLKGDVTLADITKTIIDETRHDPQGKCLAELRERLIHTAREVRNKSKQNMLLIRQSIEVNNELLTQISGLELDRVSTYNPGGRIITSQHSAIVDAKG
ncbi:MAG: flagellar protein FlgN [Planctomycetota bacterium]